VFGLAEKYVSDPRCTRDYEELVSGLARYFNDAIVANATCWTAVMVGSGVFQSRRGKSPNSYRGSTQ